MIATRSPHYRLPLNAALQHARAPSLLLSRRRLHTPSPLRQEMSSTKMNGKSPENANVGLNHVAEEVLKDQYEPGWAMPHGRYTEEDLNNVKVVHKKRDGFGDWVAATMVAVARKGFDIATRYPNYHEKFPRIKGSDTNLVKVESPQAEEQKKNKVLLAKSKGEIAVQKSSNNLPEEMELGEMRKRGLCFGPEAWLVRICFLESVAGVPGMVAASVRHLHSLRLLRRDKGWIKSLLEEAANERMHLLTALKLYKPGRFMRLMLLLTQGVFYNFFFIFYLMSPRIAHQFVGFLEEEAVYTYTLIVDEIRAGRLPEWENYPAPQIAVDYWGLKKDAKMVDVILNIRADEASHRMVNNTLASLKADDYNPFAYGDAPPDAIGSKWGFDRKEANEYFEAEDSKRRAKIHAPKHSDGEGPFQGRDGTSA